MSVTGVSLEVFRSKLVLSYIFGNTSSTDIFFCNFHKISHQHQKCKHDHVGFTILATKEVIEPLPVPISSIF